jgi:hypothetical protein
MVRAQLRSTTVVNRHCSSPCFEGPPLVSIQLPQCPDAMKIDDSQTGITEAVESMESLPGKQERRVKLNTGDNSKHPCHGISDDSSKNWR